MESLMSEGPVELLLVEDNPADQELTLHVLKRHNLANRVKIARDGAEALEFLFGAGPDSAAESIPRMILLDLKLPKVSGIEVLMACSRSLASAGSRSTSNSSRRLISSTKCSTTFDGTSRVGVWTSPWLTCQPARPMPCC
jgi:CheY-like chemotaxis protein